MEKPKPVLGDVIARMYEAMKPKALPFGSCPWCEQPTTEITEAERKDIPGGVLPRKCEKHGIIYV